MIWYFKKENFHWLLTSVKESLGHFGIQALKTQNDEVAAGNLAVAPSKRESNNSQTLQKKVDYAWTCT